MTKETITQPDLLDRLINFDCYGPTAAEWRDLRMEAWVEIRTLRLRVRQLEELNSFRVHKDNVRPR